MEGGKVLLLRAFKTGLCNAWEDLVCLAVVSKGDDQVALVYLISRYSPSFFGLAAPVSLKCNALVLTSCVNEIQGFPSAFITAHQLYHHSPGAFSLALSLSQPSACPAVQNRQCLGMA